jgi:hypothetical protein
MISSLITLRLKRRKALSIDSFELIDIKAIYRLTSFRPKIRRKGQTNIKQVFVGIDKWNGVPEPDQFENAQPTTVFDTL